MSWDRAESQVLGPAEGSVGVVAITTSSAAHSLATLLGAVPARRFITVVASVATYYLFGDSGVAVDETATTGDTRCGYITANTPTRMVATGDYIAVKAGGAGTLRVWPSSDTC